MCNSRFAASVDPAILLRSGMPSALRTRAKEVRTDFSRRSLGLFNAHDPSGSHPRHSLLDVRSAICALDSGGLDVTIISPQQHRSIQ